MKSRFSLPLTAIILISLVMTGCAAQPTPVQEPTVDTDALRTEVAQTIEAAYTLSAAQTLAAEPTATIEVPTATREATATEIAVNTPVVVSPEPSSTVAKVVYPTFTPTYYPDRAELVSINQVLGKTFKPGADFDLKFTLKNTGDRDWTTSFRLKYVSGLKPSSQSGSSYDVVYLASKVAAGKTVELVLDMIAPSAPGHYTTTWALVNDDNTTFYTVSYGFDVSN